MRINCAKSELYRGKTFTGGHFHLMQMAITPIWKRARNGGMYCFLPRHIKAALAFAHKPTAQNIAKSLCDPEIIDETKSGVMKNVYLIASRSPAKRREKDKSCLFADWTELPKGEAPRSSVSYPNITVHRWQRLCPENDLTDRGPMNHRKKLKTPFAV